MNDYESAIIATLKDAPHPLGHRDLVALIDPDGTDWRTFPSIGLALTRLYRAGVLTRERVRRDTTRRTYFVYQVAAPDPPHV